MNEANRAADDADVISVRVKELACYRERKCFSKNGLVNTGCWCWFARLKDDGTYGHIPCDEASDKQPEVAAFGGGPWMEWSAVSVRAQYSTDCPIEFDFSLACG